MPELGLKKMTVINNKDIINFCQNIHYNMNNILDKITSFFNLGLPENCSVGKVLYTKVLRLLKANEKHLIEIRKRKIETKMILKNFNPSMLFISLRSSRFLPKTQKTRKI